jgi:hypothetical protein
MALHTSGLLNGMKNTFARVARLDMASPDMLTHSERLLILRHKIAWEHYLLNHTNYTALQTDSIDNIEFLFPLPSKWPWISSQNSKAHIARRIHMDDIDVASSQNSSAYIAQLHKDKIDVAWYDWRERHDSLYEVA